MISSRNHSLSGPEPGRNGTDAGTKKRRFGAGTLRDVHLKFPNEIYEKLEQEALLNRLPVSHWVYRLCVDRPKQVVLPKGTSTKLARISELEKQVAMLAVIPKLEKQLAALTKDRDATIIDRTNARRKRDELLQRIGTGVFVVKCPGCHEKVRLDLSDELGVTRHKTDPKVSP